MSRAPAPVPLARDEDEDLDVVLDMAAIRAFVLGEHPRIASVVPVLLPRCPDLQ